MLKIYDWNHSILTFQALPVTWCTSSLTFNNCTFCPHYIYVFCIYLRTNSDLCHLQHKLIGFYNEMKSVYCAVRTGSLNKAVCASSLKGVYMTKYILLLCIFAFLVCYVICNWLMVRLCWLNLGNQLSWPAYILTLVPILWWHSALADTAHICWQCRVNDGFTVLLVATSPRHKIQCNQFLVAL
jgi:hypothetical protein